jgi:hypothetical protein
MNELQILKSEKLFRLEHPEFQLESFLFPKQLAFVKDKSPFADAVCSRRSGKTVACAADLMNTAISNEDSVALYITLSRSNAKKIIWPELQRLNRQFNLNGKENHSDLSMSFGDDSIIYMAGASDKSEIQKFRGLKLRTCYIDESQSFPPYIQDLIDDVITPALMDYGGKLRLIGTPGPIPSGYFYDCSQSENWSHHAWTFWDNPFIQIKSGMSHRELLDRELKRRGVAADDPTIQREWFGKWTMDTEALLLHYNSAINDYVNLPPQKYDFIMGIDLGFVDADAICVLAWAETDPTTYLVEELVIDKQGITELVQQIEFLQKKYSISKMVIDEGGLGKKIAEEIRRRHQLPVQAADKVRKMENMALLNDALRTARFRAKKTSRFAQDSFLLEIDRDKTTPEKIKIKDTFHSDIIDAVLYAFRESPAFSYQPSIVKPKYGTKEWAKEQVTEMEQKAEEHFKALEDSAKGFGWEW